MTLPRSAWAIASRLRFAPAIRQGREHVWVGLAGDNSVQDATTALAERIGQHAGQLDVGVFERLLDALGVLDDLARELLMRVRVVVAQLLGRRIGQ